MKQSTRHLIELYMTSVIALGQSAHYIQAWKIFVTQSASDMSLFVVGALKVQMRQI